LGYLVGVDQAEQGSHLYCRSVELGARLVAVRADDELAAGAMSLLRRQNGVGMMIR
jgi:hypothetical protein